MADNALERSKHAEKELVKAMGEVEDLFKQVLQVAVLLFCYCISCRTCRYGGAAGSVATSQLQGPWFDPELRFLYM